MSKFLLEKDGTLVNVVSLQFIKIDPENDKCLLLYRINGQIIREEYETAEEASEVYETYKEAMTDTEGPGQKELKKRIAELSNTVAEQQQTISNLETENTRLNNVIDIATSMSQDILY